jgi:hypothetical protein
MWDFVEGAVRRDAAILFHVALVRISDGDVLQEVSASTCRNLV